MPRPATPTNQSVDQGLIDPAAAFYADLALDRAKP